MSVFASSTMKDRSDRMFLEDTVFGRVSYKHVGYPIGTVKSYIEFLRVSLECGTAKQRGMESSCNLLSLFGTQGTW